MTDQSQASSQLSPLKQAFLAIEEMQARLDAAENQRSEPIAVIGMACSFPQADTLEDYWRLLSSGAHSTARLKHHMRRIWFKATHIGFGETLRGGESSRNTASLVLVMVHPWTRVAAAMANMRRHS